MSLIDRLKYDPLSEDELVYRESKDNLTLGTQVIVGESQDVVFVRGGKIADLLGPGTHTLSTANIPILQTLVNLPFGGRTPFTAEVYWVNRRSKLDLPWGTTSPMSLVDPQYEVAVPVRAYGQFGLAAGESRALVTKLAGTLRGGFSMSDVQRYFQGLVVSRVTASIAGYVKRERVPILELSGGVEAIGDEMRGAIEREFATYGLTLLNFYVMSISVPNDDEGVRKLRELMATKAEFKQLGDNYRIKRTFDVLEKAAGNESSAAGSLLAGGLGLGIGLGAGPALGQSLAGGMTLGAAACEACGATQPANARFCPNCGKQRG
jgi:membrane protease subunit (stomatin/prohibitin family)